MSGVSGLGGIQGPREPSDRDGAPRVPSARSGRGPQGRDRVEFSEVALLAGRLRDVPPVRADRVEEIRRSLRDGTYPVEANLDGAVDRLLDEESV